MNKKNPTGQGLVCNTGALVRMTLKLRSSHSSVSYRLWNHVVLFDLTSSNGYPAGLQPVVMESVISRDNLVFEFDQLLSVLTNVLQPELLLTE